MGNGTTKRFRNDQENANRRTGISTLRKRQR